MRLSTRVLAMLAPLAEIAPEIAWADPPPPSFSVDFSGASAIWNPFDGFTSCDEVEGVGTMCLLLGSVVCNGKGDCAGDTEFVFTGRLEPSSGKKKKKRREEPPPPPEPPIVAEGSTIGPFDASTACRETNDFRTPVCKTKLRFETVDELTITQSGIGTFCHSAIVGKVDGEIDANGLFTGELDAEVCAYCPDRPQICDDVEGLLELPMNPPVPWNLVVSVVQNGSKLEATAVDSFGFSYTGKGSYDKKRDESTLSLKGAKFSEAEGATIRLEKLVTTGSMVTSGRAKLSVQGNRSTADLPQ